MRTSPPTLALTLGLGLMTLAMTSGDAHALDPLCGTTITSSITLTGDVDCAGITGNAITIGANNVTIDGAGYKLVAPDAARAISATGRTGVTVKNIDVSGWCLGQGVYIQGGSGHVVENVIADGRNYGVQIESTSGVTVRNLSSDSATTAGLWLNGVTLPLTLEGLSLTNAQSGLTMTGLTGPFLIDTNTITTLEGSGTGLYLQSAKNVTVKDLTIGNRDYGIRVTGGAATSGMRFENLVLSGPSVGYGLSINGGANHVVQDVTANFRSYGVEVNSATNTTLQGLRINGASARALSLDVVTLPLTLTDNKLTNSAIGFYLASLTGPFTLSPVQLSDISGNATSISFGTVTNVTLSGLRLDGYTYGFFAGSTTTNHITFTDVDASGHGTGEGIRIYGLNNTLTNVKANLRTTGVYAVSTSNLRLDNLVVDKATSYALNIETVTGTLPTIIGAKLTNSDYGLYLYGVAGLNLTTAQLADIRGNRITVAFGGLVTNTTLDGVLLDGTAYGLYAPATNNAGNTIKNLDASGLGVGIGFYIGGANHTVKDVTIAKRASGMYIYNTQNVRLENLTIDRMTQYGIDLETLTGTAPTITNVKLTNCVTGLYLYSMAGPYTFDTTRLSQLAGNGTDITLGGLVTGVTFKDLVLPGHSYGLYVAATSNAGNTFDNLDVSGLYAGGTGLYVGGPDHQLVNVKANRRTYGVYAVSTSNLQVTGLRADGASAGALYIYNLASTATKPTIVDAKLTNSVRGLYLDTVDQPTWTIDPTALTDLSGNTTSVEMYACKGIKLLNLALPGTTYGVNVLLAAQSSGLTFEGLDVSGTTGGTGILLVGNGHTVKGVTATNRAYAVYASNTSGLTVTNLTASRMTQAGLYIGSLTSGTAPVITNVKATHSTRGVYLDGVTLPMTLGAGSITDVTGTDLGVYVASSSNITLRGLTLPTTGYGIDAGSTTNSNLLIEDVDVSGAGLGASTGLYLRGANNTLRNITAHRRSYGVYASAAANLTIQTLNATGCENAGLYLESTTLPLSLSGLSLTKSRTGLQVASVTHAFAINSGVATSLAGNRNAVQITSAPSVTVDAAGLGLTAAGGGIWTQLATNDPLCGTTLTANTTLTADLNCPSLINGTALTLGTDGITLDGAGFNVYAPHADYAIRATNRSNLTITNVKVHSTRNNGTGILLTGGSNNTLIGVSTDRLAFGVQAVSQTGLTLTNVTARGALTQGINLVGVTLPLTLSGLRATDSVTGFQIDGLTGPYTLDTASFADLSGNNNSIGLNSAKFLTLQGLTLDGVLTGVSAFNAANEGLTFKSLNVSGRRLNGEGIYLRGADHVIEDVNASHRSYGLNVTSVSNLTVRRVTADRTYTRGISLGTITLPLTLDDNRVTNSTIGLDLYGITGPYTLGPAALTNVTGTPTAIYFGSGNVKNVTVDGFTLTRSAINGAGSTNTGNTYQNLNLTGDGRGTALYLNTTGANTTVQDVTATSWVYGLDLSGGATNTVRNVTVDRAVTSGIFLGNQASSLTLDNLRVGRSATGLTVDTFTGPYTFDAAKLADLKGNVTNLNFTNVKNVTVKGLTLDGRGYGINASTNSTGNTYEDLDVSGPNAGYGISTLAANTTVRRVTCDNRVTGLSLGGSALRMDDITARTNSSYAVYVNSIPLSATAPNLTGLKLTRNGGYAFALETVATPFVVDNTVLTDVSGNVNGLYFNAVSGVTTRNLTVPTLGAAINATTGTLSNLVFEDLDVSGLRFASNGLDLRGTNHTIRRITSKYRNIGVYVAGNFSNLTIDDLTAEENAYGLYLENLGAASTPPTLSKLKVNDNMTYGLVLSSISAPTTVDGASFMSFARNLNGVLISSSSGVTLRNMTIGTSGGIGVHAITGNSNLTFRDLDLSGQGRSTGLNLTGPNMTLERVVANRRNTGVSATNASNLRIDDLTADYASSTGLYLASTSVGATAPTLSNLKLRNNVYGLQLGSWTLPMTLGPAQVGTVAGSGTGILIDNSSSVTFSGLSLTNPDAGINANNTGNAGLRFQNLDMTGQCRGAGLYVGGPDHVLDGVIASKRGTGISMTTGDRVVIRNSVIGANTTGLAIGGSSQIVNTTVVADATNTASRFKVLSSSFMLVGQTLRMSGEERVITAIQPGPFITFATAFSAIPAAGIQITGLGFGAPRVELQTSDICANGTGVSASTNLTTAGTNYWRSNTGPKHSTNPGGAGDLVTGTNITLTPFRATPTDVANDYCNQFPVANAGPDKTVCEGDLVALDGTGSYDPDLEPIEYDWAQIFGQLVPLYDADQAVAWFNAPAEAAGQTLAFQLLSFALTVNDDVVSRTDSMNVTVTVRNKAPMVEAGETQSVTEGGVVNLAATGSDPENGALTYAWTQVGGPGVVLSGSGANVSFTAPMIAGGDPAATVTLAFQASVTDVQRPDHCGGNLTALDTVFVTVTNEAHPPVADAGDDQSGVVEGDLVTLDGSASSDPDGDALTYAWVQTSGASATLTGATTVAPTFTAPAVTPGTTESLRFELTVDDGFGGTATDAVVVTVRAACTPTGPDTVCDGVDNDCDGSIDEDFVVETTTCGTGVCGATGELTCVGGHPQDSCVAGSPSGIAESVCNGADDDCDGLVDEDYVADTRCFLPGACAAGNVASSCVGSTETLCQTGAPAASDATCDGVDDDCDGQLNEDYVADTSCFLPGACAAGNVASSCVGSTETLCQTGTPAASDATCDGVDDDCDGQLNEDYVADTSCFLPGACAAGNVASSCVGSTETLCQTGTPAASDATCDNVDDDCDGVLNEDYAPVTTTCGVGACASGGVTSCPAGVVLDSCVAGTPAANDATCDDLDDDCDGVLNEDYVELPTSCGTGACAAVGHSTCVLGDEGDTCAPGTPAASDATCDNVDDDCDGVLNEDYAPVATTCGVGACASIGVTSCPAGSVVDSCQAGTPAASDATCDGVDDDCSGEADEDFVSEPTSCGSGTCTATGHTTCVLGDPGDTCQIPTADADGDLTRDCEDGCPLDPTKVLAGQCGCGTADEDPDMDGTASCNDLCPVDSAKLVPGTCGCGTPDDDVDGDGVLGCRDNCPFESNDGQLDFDNDGLGDACDPDDDNDTVLDVDDNCHFVVNTDQQNTDGADDGGDACDDDDDNDGVLDTADNCHFVANPDQADNEGDGSGDACDDDDDNDGILDTNDNCRTKANFDQVNTDGDPLGDECDRDDDNDGVDDVRDNCPLTVNENQKDNDLDGEGDACDTDDDNDGVLDTADNCQFVSNADQANFMMLDAQGDACDEDDDNDGILDATDNCPYATNADQLDTNGDGAGDACDDDDDSDGVPDLEDVCPKVADADQTDTDGDLDGDACDEDDDNDGVFDSEDGCPVTPDPLQEDFDGDGIGDVCDDDLDGDDVNDVADNCVPFANNDQLDTDGDQAGDACDEDDDNDTVPDGADNCPLAANGDQADNDGDGIGDACDDDDDNDTVLDTIDNCVFTANTDQADHEHDGLGDVCDLDDDNDTVVDTTDNCPLVANANQADHEGDGLGDVCDPDDDNDGVADTSDNCPLVHNADQANLDGDGLGDACDADRDGDGVLNVVDNCPDAANADQADLDGDSIGNVCDGDLDGDGIVNGLDNCPTTANADQRNLDLDGLGDACDPDLDGDGVPNLGDNCPSTPNPAQGDNEADGLGDLCDPDDDNDGVLDTADNCPLATNTSQANNDGDGLGDACDADDDNDGVPDTSDNCQLVANVGQTNTDGDSQGNACDPDDDDDGVLDGEDNCPLIVNPGQEDGDDDGLGDVCDADDDDDGVPDDIDVCPDTPAAPPLTTPTSEGNYCRNRNHEWDDDEDFGVPVDPSNGCSLDQLCPCPGPRGTNLEWNNHGQYVSCVTHAANSLANRGLISKNQKSTLVEAAAHSDCGDNPCKNNSLKNQAQSGAPQLVLEVPTFQRWGTSTPSSRLVYAGTTQVLPDASGRYVIPLVNNQNKVIVDSLTAQGVQSSTAIPKGAFVVLRTGAGGVVAGLKGYFATGNKVAMEVVARVVNGKKGSEKDISFEGQGNGFAVLGVANEDEFWREVLQVRMKTTVTTRADLMSFQVCR